jgi:hypothetical protein
MRRRTVVEQYQIDREGNDMSYNQTVTLGTLFDDGLATRREVLGAAMSTSRSSPPMTS